jgi:hypothetical protein
MHHKENFDWFMNTKWCGHTSYWSNASTVSRNGICFGMRKEMEGGVILDVTVCYCSH